MNTFEFIKFEKTPGEKHIGIATIKGYGKIFLRFKIILTKDGSSFFPAPASYKIPKAGEPDCYVPAFTLDSHSEKEELDALIKGNVKRFIENARTVQSDFSLFVSPDNNAKFPTEPPF